MKPLLRHVITALFLSILTSISDSFRIRRSGVAGYDDPYGLTNAFNEYGRPRRMDYSAMLRNELANNDDSYFNPNSVPEFDNLDPDDFIRGSSLDDVLGDSEPLFAYESPYQSFSQLEELPVRYTGQSQRGFNPMKRRAYSPRRRVPSLDELRSLFGETEVPPMKRIAPVKRQEPEKEEKETKEETETDKKESEKIIKDKAVLASEWGKLINAAEQLTKTEVSVVDKTEKLEKEKEEKIDTDLKDAFSDVKSDAVKDIKDDTKEKTVVENRLEITNMDDLSGDQAQSKSKRASSPNGDDSDYVLGLLKQIDDLKEKVSNLEMVQMLEDRENDFLANALKYATLDQIHESDDLVSDEYNNIAKATETEELIQQISEALEEKEKAEKNKLDIAETIREAEVKREGPPNPLAGQQWLDAPVSEKVGLGAILEDDVDDEDVDTDDLGEEQLINVPFPEEDMESAEDEDEAEIIEEEKEGKLKQQEVLLAKLLSSLSPVTVQGIINDLNEKGEEQVQQALQKEVCPAISELSQRCAFADARNIPIDEDARNLCVRHQICYTCGKALGISAENCDEGYKGTVIAECNGNVSCIRAAAFFLQLMTSRYHKYEDNSPKGCENLCVADFIYGVE